MNKKTRIILIIVLIVAFIALIILLLHPWKSNKSDGTEYYMSKKYNYWFEVDNGQATLIKYTGEEYHVKLPSSVYGVPVTKLGEYEVLNLSGAAKRGIFEDSNVSEVSIPEGVTEICNDAFYSSGLCEVNIPSSVRVVGTRAFAFCKYLRSVEFKTGIKTISESMFSNCKNLRFIELPSSVEKIEGDAFAECALQKIDLPENINTIESYAFRECDSLTFVTIPPKVTSINSGTFYSCDFLEKVNIHDEVKYIANDAFDRCDKLTICGIKGSYAEQYAKKHNIPFEKLDTTIQSVN